MNTQKPSIGAVVKEFKVLSLLIVIAIACYANMASAGTPVSMVFKSAPQSIGVGLCSAAVTVEARDANGLPANVPGITKLFFTGSSSSLRFFKDAGCATSASNIMMQAGTSTKSYYVKGLSAGSQKMVVATNNYNDDVQYINIGSSPSPTPTPTLTPSPTPIADPTPAPSPTPAKVLFYDDFSNYATTGCLADGTTIGNWNSVFAGYGCNSIVSLPEGKAASLKPMASTTSSETHAGLLVGPSFSGSYIFETTVKTQQQLRVGSAPNPWEVAWVVWNYTDNVHFYYFIAKPNGWELGKEDPAYPGAQRFLAAGSNLAWAIGQWIHLKVTQNNNVISVSVNGVLVTTFTDNERPYSSGKIGFYSEDSHVYLKSAKVSAP